MTLFKYLIAFLFALIAGLVCAALLTPLIVETQQADVAAFNRSENIKFSSANEAIAYQEVQKQAPQTILFIGGLSAWSGTWQNTFKALKDDNYNLIALDLPPFGYSIVNEKSRYYRDIQAERILGFIREKKLEKVIMVAHSYGAGPATEAVMRDQSLFAKLVIIAGVLNVDEPPKGEPPFLLKTPILRDTLIGGVIHLPIAEGRLKSFTHQHQNITPALANLYIASFNVKETHHKLGAWVHDYGADPLNYKSNFSANYKALNIPVRIIWGEKDTLTPIEKTTILLKFIPNVKLTPLKNVGHIPMIEDIPAYEKALKQSVFD